MYISDSNGYSIPNVDSVKNLPDNTAIEDGTAFLLYDNNYWVNLNTNSNLAFPHSILTNIGSFIRLPFNPDSSKLDSVSNVVINTETYTLDFKVLNKNIHITLQSNTSLTFVNLVKNSFFTILIDYNGYSITNFNNLGLIPKVKNNYSVNYQLIYNYYSQQIINVFYLDSIYFLPLLSIEGLQYLPMDHSTISYSPTFFNHPSYRLCYSAAVTTGTNYTLPINTEFNITDDWELDLYFNYADTIYANTGVVATLGPLFIRCVDYMLHISLIGSTGEETYLTYVDIENDIFSNPIHLVINSSQNILRVFENGNLHLVTKVQYKNIHSLNITNLGIGKNIGYIPYPLQNCNKNFEGDVLGVILRTKLLYFRSHQNEDIYEKTLYSQINELSRFDLGMTDYSANGHIVTLLSDDTNTPHLTTAYPYIYDEYPVLDKVHHLEKANTQTNSVTNFCVEAIICNVTGNTRGTILYNGDANDYNYHLGIYDNYLRCDLNNGAFSITSSTTVPTNQYVKVGIYSTDNGNTKTLFINEVETSAVDVNNTALYAQSTANNIYNYPLSIKRAYTQDISEATINTTLYPSKSHIYIAMLRITHASRYTSLTPKDALYTRFTY